MATIGDLAAPPVPPATAHDVGQGLRTRSSVSGLSVIVRISSGPNSRTSGAVHRFHLADHVRAIEFSAVGHRGHHIGELQRRYGDIALADRHRNRFARKPGLAVSFSFPLGVRNCAALSSSKATPVFSPKPKARAHLAIRSTPSLGPQLIKVCVAGLDDRFVQVYRAVAAFFPIAKAAIAE